MDKNTNILIVGLGLLGGSYAKALTKKGYQVSAIDKNEESIKYALEKNIITFGTTKEDKTLINNADFVIFALYPHIFLEWIKTHKDDFKNGAIITDVTGVKGAVVSKVQDILPKTVEFISAHPMAGKELSGVKNADYKIFKNANYIVVPTEKNTHFAIEECKKLGQELGFLKISTLSVEQHDEMIAFLSQLTHCIAVALMCSNDNENLSKYTGDSFRDLTRIAKINDEMWSELFLLNKTQLLSQMDAFKQTFDKLYDTIKNDDCEKMREMMRLSTSRRAFFDKKEN